MQNDLLPQVAALFVDRATLHTVVEYVRFNPQRWLALLSAGLIGIIALALLAACGRPDVGSASTAPYPAPVNATLAAYPASTSPTTMQPVSPTTVPVARSSAPSLIGASPQAVGQVAIAVTMSRFPSLSGTPQLTLARPVTPDDLTAMGLPSEDYSYCTEPPALMLVIVKGDFDMTSMGGPIPATAHPRATYVVYIFDLRAGVPITVTYSPNGGRLRRALNDPSLPDDPTAPAATGPTVKSVLPPLATPSAKRVCGVAVTAGPALTPTP
jgi:hypothetical protein